MRSQLCKLKTVKALMHDAPTVFVQPITHPIPSGVKHPSKTADRPAHKQALSCSQAQIEARVPMKPIGGATLKAQNSMHLQYGLTHPQHPSLWQWKHHCILAVPYGLTLQAQNSSGNGICIQNVLLMHKFTPT